MGRQDGFSTPSKKPHNKFMPVRRINLEVKRTLFNNKKGPSKGGEYKIIMANIS